MIVGNSVPALRSFRDEYEDGEQTPLNRNASACQSPTSQRSTNRKGYGVKFISEKTIHERYTKRRKMVDRRVKVINLEIV